MPKRQEKVYGKGHLHFISCTCYQHQPKLGQEKHRDVFVRLLEELRVKFRFDVVGYGVMPDHVRLLLREPEIDTTGNAVEMLRARYRRRYNSSARSDEQVWESRIADAHVLGADAVAARLLSMHQEPVKAGLVPTAEDWPWSSARAYAGLSEGVVTVTQFPAVPGSSSSTEARG